MAEPDHVFVRPMPNLAADFMPAAYPFFYIEPKKYEREQRKQSFGGVMSLGLPTGAGYPRFWSVVRINWSSECITDAGDAVRRLYPEITPFLVSVAYKLLLIVSELLRRYYPKEKGPITSIDPIGNSPVIIKKVSIQPLAERT